MSSRAKLQITPEDFCAALVASLVIEDKKRIPADDRKVEAAFRRIINQLQQSASEAYEANDEDFAFVLLRVIDGLAPNPNTGAFDDFWAVLRRLQPGRLGVSNPLYPAFEIKISKAHAKSELKRVPPRLRDVVNSSAQMLAQAL